MTRKIRNILCVSIIVAACAVPAIVFATESDSSDSSVALNEGMIGVEIADHDKFTQEQLDEMFNEWYDNDVYRDIFYNTVANPRSDALTTITIPIKEPVKSAAITTADANYSLPVECSDSCPFKDLQFLRSDDGKIVYRLTISEDETISDTATLSSDKIDAALSAVFQNGYPSIIPSEYAALNEQDFEAGTAIAAYIAYNNLDSSVLDEWLLSADEDANVEFKDYIKSLLDSKYEEKYIDINLAGEIEIDDGFSGVENISMKNNTIQTNYDQAYIDLYDTKGYYDLSVYNPQVDMNEDIRNIYHSGENFDIRLSKNELLTRAGLVRNLGHYRGQAYDPINDNVQLICAGEDISDCEYSCGNDKVYIVQEQTYCQFVDVDMQPELFSHLFKAYDVNFSFCDKDSGSSISALQSILYKETNDGYKKINVIVSDENGESKIINLEPGNYRLIVDGTDSHFEECFDFSIGTDNSDLTVLTTYDFKIPTKAVATKIVVKDGDGSPISNTSFAVTNVDTLEEIKCVSNNNGEISLTNISVGTYMINPLEGNYVDFSRLLYVGNTSAYAEADSFEIIYVPGGNIDYKLDNDWSRSEQMSKYDIAETHIDTSLVESRDEPQPFYTDEDDNADFSSNSTETTYYNESSNIAETSNLYFNE